VWPRGGEEARKSARRLETSRGRFSARAGDEDEAEDDEADARELVRCVDWSSIGACGSGERCALATCSTRGACEVFAPPRGETSAWTRAVDVSEAWRRACCVENEDDVLEALVVEEPVRVDESSSVRPTRARELASSVAARERDAETMKMELDDAEAMKQVMESTPLLQPSRSSIDEAEGGDDVYVYGALRSGARAETSAGADASTWRLGTIVSANFNAATRARIEYDARDARGEFLVWSSLERRRPDDAGVVTFPPESSLVACSAPPTAKKRARPMPQRRDEDVSTLREGEYIEIMRANEAATWRLARVCEVDGRKMRVRLSESDPPTDFPLAGEWRRRTRWMGADVGWVPADDVPTLPKELRASDDSPRKEEGARPVDDADVVATDADRLAGVDARASDRRVGVQAAVDAFFNRRTSNMTYATRFRMCDEDAFLCRRVCEEFAATAEAREAAKTAIKRCLANTKKTIERAPYDDAPIRKAALSQFMACAWVEIRVAGEKKHALACGAKSGHVAVFHITDDARATCVATKRIASDAWITTLTWRRNASAGCVDLVVGCSSGAVVRARGTVADVERAFADANAAPRRDLFTDCTRLCDANGAAVTCASIDGDHVIVGKANGDVFCCDFTRERDASVRRVSLEPIAGACFTRGRGDDRLAHVISGTTHVIARLSAARDVLVSVERVSAASRRRDAARAVDACLALTPSPTGDVVLRCDAYEPTANLPNLDGMKRAKFWRGVVVAVKHPSAAA